ncbi:MAG: permease-like cell division protein FtsX [Pseudomonadota bacterium]
MITYFSRHLQVLFATLGSMIRTPLTSANTIAIIAITLLLPTLLYVTVKSAEQLSGNWQGRPQISIFMEADVTSQEAELIYQELQLHPAIALAELVSPQQALAEFRTLSNMDYELDFLGENPLPASIVVMPDDANTQSDRLLALKDELSKIEGIDTIRLDLDWTDRFNAILLAVSRVAGLLSALLGIGLLLIVGNTIKLLILNRREEIEITRLVGGSNAFVRRPFLYYGALFGVFGAVLALLLLLGAAYLVNEPLSRLAELYQRDTLLYSLSIIEIGVIILVGATLGWVAARWSVGRHLSRIKPQ